MTRAHVVLPDELIRQVDAEVGKRQRSRYIADALREKLRRDKLLRALDNAAGILTARAYPEWATSRKAAAWVRETRRSGEHADRDR